MTLHFNAFPQPLDKQKEGKKRMREYGSVCIPQETFIAALRMGDDA